MLALAVVLMAASQAATAASAATAEPLVSVERVHDALQRPALKIPPILDSGPLLLEGIVLPRRAP